MSAQPFRRKQQECTCPHGERSLGRLYHVNIQHPGRRSCRACHAAIERRRRAKV